MGLVANDPVNTPVLAFVSASRSISERREAACPYATTAAGGVAAPVVQRAEVPSGQVGAVSAPTIGCSGASTR